MKRTYEGLTDAGRRAVIREAERCGAEVTYDRGGTIRIEGEVSSVRHAARNLRRNYDNGDGYGIY